MRNGRSLSHPLATMDPMRAALLVLLFAVLAAIAVGLILMSRDLSDAEQQVEQDEDDL